VLVKQALDILIPALPRRLPLGDYKIPLWIRYTKKILVEEGHSVANLIHIFQLIVRHSDLFYSCRAQFVPQMVNSLSRLGLPQNSPPENRRLAIELAGLVVAWEKQRQAEAKVASDTEGHVQSMDMPGLTPAAGSDLTGGAINAKRPSDASGFSDDLTKRVKTENGLPTLGAMSPNSTSTPNIGTPVSAGQSEEEYKPNAAMEEMIINFLIRVRIVKEHFAIICVEYC
jgi:transformation/transcription domain-associated protein